MAVDPTGMPPDEQQLPPRPDTDEPEQPRPGSTGAQPSPRVAQEGPLTSLPTAIPPKPDPPQGAYSPEQEQRSLRAAEAIEDPGRRMRVQDALKREYANRAIEDGVMQRAREDALKRAASDYSGAIQMIQDDQNVGWQQKQVIAKEVIKRMWEDPRLQYGDTQRLLEAHMMGLAGIQDVREYGPMYTQAFKGVADGSLNDPRQVLKMEADGQLTVKGGDEIIKAIGQAAKPEGAWLSQRKALALQEIKNIVYRDLDENSEFMKPSQKQIKRLTDVYYAFNDAMRIAGTDDEKIAKLTSQDSIRDLVEQVYPRYERDVDYMSRGAPINVGGVIIPPTVKQDDKSQTAYRDIIATGPTQAIVNGAPQKIDQATYQKYVEVLRRTGDIKAFNQRFPDKDAGYILKVTPYIAAAPGAAPPPTVEPAEVPAGFWSGLLQRLKPPEVPGPDILTGVQQFGNSLLTPEEQQAKK